MKKIICFLLVAVMSFSFITGCSSSDSSSPSVSSSSDAGSTEPEAKTRTVIDDTGREIEVPAEVNRIVITSFMPICSVYCMVGGDPAKIVGMPASTKNAAETSFLGRVANFDHVSTSFADGESVNVEELMNLDPDVVFYNSSSAADSSVAEQLEALGVPCIGFSTNIPNTIDIVSIWASEIGQVLGTENKADEITAYGKQVEQMVIDRVSQIPEEDRRSALILTNYTTSGITAAGSTFGRYWLSTIGANNVAIEIEGSTGPVSLEQIYDWDPDVIFLNSFSAFTEEDIANGTAVPGHDWTGLTSVQNGEFYKMPVGMYYWFPPCSDSPLALQWMAKKLYPDLFEDLDIDAEIKDYFQNFYGVTLSDEDLYTLYHPPVESAR